MKVWNELVNIFLHPFTILSTFYYLNLKFGTLCIIISKFNHNKHFQKDNYSYFCLQAFHYCIQLISYRYTHLN
jgi:hypothetical protein